MIEVLAHPITTTIGIAINALALLLAIYMRGGHAVFGLCIRRPFLVAIVAVACAGLSIQIGGPGDWLWPLAGLAALSAATFTLGHGTLLGFLDRGVDGRASGWAPFSTGVLTGVAFVAPLSAALAIGGSIDPAVLLLFAGAMKPVCYGVAGMAEAPPVGLPDRDAFACLLHGGSIAAAILIPLAFSLV